MLYLKIQDAFSNHTSTNCQHFPKQKQVFIFMRLIYSPVYGGNVHINNAQVITLFFVRASFFPSLHILHIRTTQRNTSRQSKQY